MSRPIRLWRPRQISTSDDAGITILKCTLPQASRNPAPYEIAAKERGRPNHLPSLTYFCIQTLIDYPDQVHALGPLRLTYRPPDTPLAHDILRELIPSYRPGETLDIRLVDPRLWALLIQLYHGLPSQLRSYKLPLADRHLPLLQRIPPTADFALITILALPGCQELTDTNIVLLKEMHTLCAFDASGTALSSWAVKVLAKTLTAADDEDVVEGLPSANRRGPWGLRILSLRNCMNADDTVFEYLPLFPLLSVVDLRGTRCRSTRVKHFRASANARLFHPTTLPDVLSALEKIASEGHYSLYSHPQPYLLNVVGLEYGSLSSAEHRALRTMDLPGAATSIGARRDVFLAPRLDPSSPPLSARHSSEATTALDAIESDSETDDSDYPEDMYNCLGGMDGGYYPSGDDTVAATAWAEALQEARGAATRRFYGQPVPAPRAPREPKPDDPKYTLKYEDKPFMLFRPPPAWSSLPAPETRSADAPRKKVKVDPPLADTRTLSADGVRERAAVKTAVTALHASLKERTASLGAIGATPTSESTVAEERKVSSNPFARSVKSNSKPKVTSATEGQKATSSAAPAKHTVSNIADETPVSSLSFKSSLIGTAPKKLKPISKLWVPPLPPEALARAAAEEKAQRRRDSAHQAAVVNAKKTQATLDPALLAASKRPDSGGSSAGFKPVSTLSLKNQTPIATPVKTGKPTSVNAPKSKPGRKSASSSFDWSTWSSHQ